jgi:excisionase family DNA binding protein
MKNKKITDQKIKISDEEYQNTVNFDNEELLTRAELIKKLRCSKSKIYQLMKSKKLTYLRFGRNLYFKMSDVLNAMQKFNTPGGVL